MLCGPLERRQASPPFQHPTQPPPRRITVSLPKPALQQLDALCFQRAISRAEAPRQAQVPWLKRQQPEHTGVLTRGAPAPLTLFRGRRRRARSGATSAPLEHHQPDCPRRGQTGAGSPTIVPMYASTALILRALPPPLAALQPIPNSPTGSRDSVWLGATKALGGLAIGLIALFSSYDHLSPPAAPSRSPSHGASPAWWSQWRSLLP